MPEDLKNKTKKGELVYRYGVTLNSTAPTANGIINFFIIILSAQSKRNAVFNKKFTGGIHTVCAEQRFKPSKNNELFSPLGGKPCGAVHFQNGRRLNVVRLPTA